MLRNCEGLLGRDPRTLGKDFRTLGRDPRTLGRDPRTQLMVRALGLEAALAILLSVVLIGMLLVVIMTATVLLILVATLVRVEVRLVVGGALALPSPRDPFADNAWGVWGAGGGLRNHCEDVCRRGNGHGGLGDGLCDGETFVAGRLESRLSVVTWNCATLFGAAPRSREQRRRHAAKIDRVAFFLVATIWRCSRGCMGMSRTLASLRVGFLGTLFLAPSVVTLVQGVSLLPFPRNFEGGSPLAGVRR